MKTGNRQTRSIEDRYKEEYSLRKRFENDIREIVGNIIRAAGYEITLLTSRTKEILKFIAKANLPAKNGKGKKYTRPFTQITDVTGIRVIVQYKDKAEEIENLLKGKLDYDPLRSRNTIKESKEYEFNYPAIHIVASMTDAISERYECQCIQKWKIEIQIRTTLEHAWSELSRSLFYNKDVRKEHKRELNALSAIIESNDKEFIRLRNAVENIPVIAPTTIQSAPQLMDSDSVVNILQKSKTIANIVDKLAHLGLKVNDTVRNQYTPPLSEIFSRYNIKFGEDLEGALSQNEDNIVSACKLYMDATEMTNFAKDTLLIAGLAIVENGCISPIDYSNSWTDTWKNGFRSAAKEYNKAHGAA